MEDLGNSFSKGTGLMPKPIILTQPSAFGFLFSKILAHWHDVAGTGLLLNRIFLGSFVVSLLVIHSAVFPDEKILFKFACLLFLSSSVQETRETDHFSAHIHEVQADQAEAEAKRYPQGEGVWLWPRRTSPQLRPWRWALPLLLLLKLTLMLQTVLDTNVTVWVGWKA